MIRKCPGRALASLTVVSALLASQPPSLRAQQTDTSAWTAVDQPMFSFTYPTGWQLQSANDGAVSGVIVIDPTSPRMLTVGFEPGVANHPGILNQCSGVDEYLDKVYQKGFAFMATGTGQYPYTTVTHDDYKPGWLGGKSTWVTVVHVEAYQKPVTLEYWVAVVPRQGGFYTLMYRHASEPMGVSEPFRQQFLQSVVFKAAPLEKNAYCNYLGK